MWSNYKLKALYNVFNTLNSPYNHVNYIVRRKYLYFVYFTTFWILGQKFVKSFFWFFGKFKTSKGHSEINWPLKNEKINRAATRIKAAWRGYKARLALKDLVIAKKLAEVQRRVSEAHKNVTEDKKLCNRTAYALDYLFTYKDMGMLILSLNNLNVTLR